MPTRDELKVLHTMWWLMVLFGLVSLGIGIFFVASPHETLSTFTVIAGIFFLLQGVLSVLGSIFGKGEERGLLAILGVLCLVAGLLLIKHPFNSLIVFVMIVGIWFVAAGVIRLAAAIGDPSARGGNLAVAAIDLVAGIAILAWPDLTLSTLAVIIGIILIIRGLASVFIGFELRGALREIEEPAPVASS